LAAPDAASGAGLWRLGLVDGKLGDGHVRRDRLHHHGRGHPVGTAVDTGHQPEEELAYPVGLLVNPLENLAFDLHGHEPMAVGRFDAQIADLKLAPSDELAGRSRAVAAT
jgi:hypothetical protein